jgi:D-alanine--poly(phosphoribitol) ligase subunit 2
VTTADIIKKKVQELAKELGRNASTVTEDDVLPETGVLDSAAIIELIVWVETEFGMDIDQSELSLDNFGSIRQMTTYIEARRV